MIVDELIALLGFDFKGGGDLARFKKGIKEGEAAANGFVNKLGSMAVAAGAAFAAIGGLTLGAGFLQDATKDAIAFEDQMTEIQKKAGATAEDMKGIRAEILELGASGEIASTFDEIAAAYERGAAGGLPVGELKEFARVSAMAADAFGGMSSEDIANAFLGFKTMFDVPVDKMERIADLVNTLGDAGIADESGIIDFIDRAGPVMSTAGFSIEQVAAYGSALANLKIPAERAATAMDSITQKILAPGGLPKAARAAFVDLVGDTKQFTSLLMKDAPAAMDKVLVALGKLDPSKRAEVAQQIFGQDHLGAILAMVNGVDEVRRNLELAADEQKFLGSLGASYALKLDDTSSSLKVMQNRFKRVRIAIGNEILPLLNKTAKRTGEWLDNLYNSGMAASFGRNIARVLDATLSVAERAAIAAYRIGEGFVASGNAVVDFTSKVTGLDRSLSAVALTAGGLALSGFGRGILKFAANRAPIAAAALALEDLFRAFNGEESYIGSLEGAQGVIAQIKADAAEAGVAFDALAASLNDIFAIKVAEGETPLDALTRSATALMNSGLVEFLRDLSSLIREVTGVVGQLTSEVDFQKAVDAGRVKQGKGFLARQGIGETPESTLESARAGGWQGAAPANVASPVTTSADGAGASAQAGSDLRSWITGWFSTSEANDAATQSKLDNLSANIGAMGNVAPNVTSTITNQDQRQFPVTNNVSAPVTVNVQQATQAPAAVGAAVSNTMRTAAVPPARIAGGTDAP